VTEIKLNKICISGRTMDMMSWKNKG